VHSVKIFEQVELVCGMDASLSHLVTAPLYHMMHSYVLCILYYYPPICW